MDVIIRAPLMNNDTMVTRPAQGNTIWRAIKYDILAFFLHSGTTILPKYRAYHMLSIDTAMFDKNPNKDIYISIRNPRFVKI